MVEMTAAQASQTGSANRPLLFPVTAVHLVLRYFVE